MKRIIVDFKKLDKSLLDLLVERYPDGYGDSDIICFRNALREWVECVEVKTEDTIYLVKVSKRLTIAMKDYEVSDNKEDYNFLEEEPEDFEEE